mgnify:CR=1 FL=1
MYTLIDKLHDTQNLTKNEWQSLFEHLQGVSIVSALSEYLFSLSEKLSMTMTMTKCPNEDEDNGNDNGNGCIDRLWR